MNDATVNFHIEIHDAQILWDHAFKIFKKNTTATLNIEESFAHIAGPRGCPIISGCLQTIYNPMESPPGTVILDSEASIEI